MATKFEVRQLVRTAGRNRLEKVQETGFERVARMDYAHFVETYPGEYFELVRIEHSEECLQHNGKPDVSPNAALRGADREEAGNNATPGSASS